MENTKAFQPEVSKTLDWIYAMVNAIASRKCQAGLAWEPTITATIRSLPKCLIQQ